MMRMRPSERATLVVILLCMYTTLVIAITMLVMTA